MWRRFVQINLASAVLTAAPALLSADEGMWLLNRLPLEHLRQAYGFDPSPEWVELVQQASLKFEEGGSGSFVSEHGLVFTNHHVGSDAIKDVSDESHDYIRGGFYAATREQELKCAGVRLQQLQRIEDVTARVNAAVQPAMSAAQAEQARQSTIADIEREASVDGDREAQVIKLYHGARYHLYVYKIYDDVRLVMAPESAIAFLGGDVDNFEYPRYNLDISFFRAYENGAPARTPQHFTWSAGGPADGELVFMAGNPARTRRQYTVEHLHFLRDVELPLILNIYNQREVALTQFSMRDAEHRRIGKEILQYTQNGRKAFSGILAGLLDDGIFQRKLARQQALQEFVRGGNRGPSNPQQVDAWLELDNALKELRGYYPAYFLMENRRSTKGELFNIAKRLLRAATEREKPDGERLTGYRESDLQALRGQLFSAAPIHDNLETLMLSDAFTRFARILGAGHPITRAALAGRKPEDHAAEIVAGCSLRDVGLRQALYDGGLSAIRASSDPMIKLVSALEPQARELLDRYDREFTGIETSAYARIAEADFAMHGEGIYPDATHTLRLSIGSVAGYVESGRSIPAFTNLAGAFELAARHENEPPFQLPASWQAARDKLDLSTPFNFVSTNDIIGGNSGSPAFNRSGEIVGIVFDGNIHSLIWDIEFDQQQARAVSVHSQAILEALQKIYGADALVRELRGH